MSAPLTTDYHPTTRDSYNTTGDERMAMALAAIADNSAASQNGYALVPTGSANGVPIGPLPAVCRGVRVILKPGDGFTYVLAAAQPTTAPAAGTAVAIANPSSSTVTMDWPEYFAAPLNMYVIGALTGTPQFRFM